MVTAIIVAGAALAITGMLCLAALKAWRSWCDLRRYEIAAANSAPEAADPTPGVRIEMADIRERLRRLEAIATGVDL
jgi:hypothetical protein